MSDADTLTRAGASPEWENIWQNGLKPGERWDAKGPSPMLARLLEQGTLPKGKALVPGCGRGYDIGLFSQHGYDALGIDLSQTAVASAKEYLKTIGSTQTEPKIQLQNFFELEGKFDVIYDYTFLCALNPDARIKWAEKMKSLINDDGELVTMIFPIVQKEGGPPFAMSIDLVKSLLEPVGFRSQTLEMIPDELCHEGREGKTALGRWKLQKE